MEATTIHEIHSYRCRCFDFALHVLSRLTTLEGPVNVCIVCFVFAYRAHRHREVQKAYQTASTGRQQSRKAVGRTAPDDKDGRPFLVQRFCLASTYSIAKPQNTSSTEQSLSLTKTQY